MGLKGAPCFYSSRGMIRDCSVEGCFSGPNEGRFAVKYGCPTVDLLALGNDIQARFSSVFRALLYGVVQGIIAHGNKENPAVL